MLKDCKVWITAAQARRIGDVYKDTDFAILEYDEKGGLYVVPESSFFEEHDDSNGVWIAADGNIHYSSGFPFAESDKAKKFYQEYQPAE